MTPSPSRPPSPEIRITELEVRFRAFCAVDRLSLEVGRGELFGFLGPNGAGKTTTIRVLTGTLAPTSGEVEVGGLPVPAAFDAVKALFGYVPDTENHFEDLSARQNLKIFARLYGAPISRVGECLARLELDEVGHLPVRRFSKGMKKKLLIAREILHRPRILYCDEPTANLDAHSTAVVRELLREIAAEGTTVFLTTHDMDEVEAICDRVAILARGRLVDCDSPTSFMTRHAKRRVVAHFDEGGVTRREVFELDDERARERLAGLVREDACARVHSQDFRFEDVFLELTGEAYD